MTKLALISDTHCQHNQLLIPECDILIHAGDASYDGTYYELTKFLDWYKGLTQAKHKIYVPGNHDFDIQKALPMYIQEYGNDIDILVDKAVLREQLRIYGTPWTGYFFDWAFNGIEERNGTNGYKGGPGVNAIPDEQHPLLSEVYSKIPNYTDILVCHGPPDLGSLGTTRSGERVGSLELLKVINKLDNIKLGVYGHIHEGRGSYMLNNAIHMNVSSLCRDYKVLREPVVIEI